MALFGEADDKLPDDEGNVEDVKPKVPSYIETPAFKGITIDTQYVPQSSLLQWIEGSLYTVDYYSQVLDQHNEPTPLNLSRSPVYQQYRVIRGMDLKITNPISFAPDPVTREMEVRGSGITYPFLVPNVGDMFVSDVGDGRIGLFTITEATRATILKDSVYNIEFVLQTVLDEEHLADLKRKTIEQFIFSRESLVTGAGPFVTEPQYQRRNDYLKLRTELISRYLSDFYSRQFTTLLVPDQQLTTYDHFVVMAVRKLISPDEHPLMRKVRELPVSPEPVMKLPTLWEAVIRHEPNRLLQTIQTTQLVSTNTFMGRPVMQSLSYTGIKRIVFPIDTPTDIDSYYNGKAYRNVVGMKLSEGKPRRHEYGNVLSQEERNSPWFNAHNSTSGKPAERVPSIYPVVKDNYYVLSDAFYSKDESVRSCLEVLVEQVMKAQPISHEHLDQVLRHIWDWDNLERYYYYPLVWMILRFGSRH